jgi:CheY-like chemotaxis protein
MARVLIVEDDERLKMTYGIVLGKEGHEVEHAADGQEALDKLSVYAPDVVLLDLHMPNIDGIEFLKRADMPAKYPSTKVIVFSNMEQPEQLEQAYELGADRYMLKASTSPKQLADLISNTLQNQTHP